MRANRTVCLNTWITNHSSVASMSSPRTKEATSPAAVAVAARAMTSMRRLKRPHPKAARHYITLRSSKLEFETIQYGCRCILAIPEHRHNDFRASFAVSREHFCTLQCQAMTCTLIIWILITGELLLYRITMPCVLVPLASSPRLHSYS